MCKVPVACIDRNARLYVSSLLFAFNLNLSLVFWNWMWHDVLSFFPAKQDTIQAVVDNLHISCLEYRSENDSDVRKYIHNKKLELLQVCSISFVSCFGNTTMWIGYVWWSGWACSSWDNHSKVNIVRTIFFVVCMSSCWACHFLY